MKPTAGEKTLQPHRCGPTAPIKEHTVGLVRCKCSLATLKALIMIWVMMMTMVFSCGRCQFHSLRSMKQSEWPTFDIWSDYCHKFIMVRIAVSKRSTHSSKQYGYFAMWVRNGKKREKSVCVYTFYDDLAASQLENLKKLNSGFRIYLTIFFKVLPCLRSIHSLRIEYDFSSSGCQGELKMMMVFVFSGEWHNAISLQRSIGYFTNKDFDSILHLFSHLHCKNSIRFDPENKSKTYTYRESQWHSQKEVWYTNLFPFMLMLFARFACSLHTSISQTNRIPSDKTFREYSSVQFHMNILLYYKFHGLYCPFNLILKFSGEAISYNWIFCISMTFQRHSIDWATFIQRIFRCIAFLPVHICTFPNARYQPHWLHSGRISPLKWSNHVTWTVNIIVSDSKVTFENPNWHWCRSHWCQ